MPYLVRIVLPHQERTVARRPTLAEARAEADRLNAEAVKKQGHKKAPLYFAEKAFKGDGA